MEEIIEIVVNYVSIWAPSLVAIISMCTTVIISISKCKAAIDEYKNDKTLKEVNDKLNSVISENEQLVKCNKLLLDNITKIQGYVDAKEKEDARNITN